MLEISTDRMPTYLGGRTPTRQLRISLKTPAGLRREFQGQSGRTMARVRVELSTCRRFARPDRVCIYVAD